MLRGGKKEILNPKSKLKQMKQLYFKWNSIIIIKETKNKNNKTRNSSKSLVSIVFDCMPPILDKIER